MIETGNLLRSPKLRSYNCLIPFELKKSVAFSTVHMRAHLPKEFTIIFLGRSLGLVVSSHQLWSCRIP